jgi:hypothetical protein
MVSKSNNKYTKTISIVDSFTNLENSYATKAFRRNYYLLGKNLNILKTFQYQRFYDYDKKVEMTNYQYYQLIKEKTTMLEKKDILIVELNDNFVKEFSDSLELMKFENTENNIFIFYSTKTD